MQKIQVIGLREQLEKAMTFLQERNVMEVKELSADAASRVKPATKHDHNLELKLANLNFAIKLLSNYEKNSLLPSPIILNATNMESIAKTFNYEEAVKQAQRLEEEMVITKNRLTEIQQDEKVLEPWKNLLVHLDTPHITKTSKLTLGVIGKLDYEKFQKSLSDLGLNIDLHTVSEDQSKAYFSLIYLLADADQISGLMSEYRVQEAELKTAEGSVKQHLHTIKKESAQLTHQLNKTEKELAELAKNLDSLKVVHDYYLWQFVREERKNLTGETEYTFVLTGWAKKGALKALKEDIKGRAESVAIVEVAPEEGEQSPVALRNKGFMKMFESVTRIYGLPLPTEIDPTPLLAAFFIIFFGLCLSDSGYGFILFSLTFIALKFLKIPEENKGLIRLLMWGGLATFIAGIIFGGWFGLTPEQAPSFLTKMVPGANGEEVLGFKGQLINPVGSGAIIFLGLAFALGIIQVLVGLMIDGYWKIKDGAIMDAMLDSFLWIIFLVSLLSLGATGMIDSLTPYAGLSKNIALGLTIALVLTQGRKAKSIAGKLGLGILSLYSVVGYFSDVLSYSRLMALGLGTGIIAFAMNTIAGIMVELVPYVGFIIGIIVIILGHSLNIALSTLGAFIHSSRLQFVEFFGKFMEGGGKDFEPFTRECKYTHLKD